MTRYAGGEAVYRIAERFVDVALRRDDSLFTPGRAIWSPPYLDELDRAYVQRPDLGSGSFEEKLKAQLDGVSPEATQLMAEALFVYYLPARFNIAGHRKRQAIDEVLGWMPAPVTLPTELREATEEGVGSGGPGFHLFKWASLSFLLVFARRWKQSAQEVRERCLGDPWAFRDFIAQVPTDGGGIYGRESLLHLVFPDTFERIFSGQDKWRLASALGDLVDDPNANIDRRISQIRAKLEARFGSGFDFYETDGVRALWKRFDSRIDEFVYWASRFHELPSYGPGERDYKLKIVQRLTDAKTALLEDGDWFPLLKRSFQPPNNLTSWQLHDAFLKWCQEDLVRAAAVLRALWTGDADPLTRLATFFARVPRASVPGLGGRTALGSFLMLAADPYQYPPYRVAGMHAAYRLTDHDPGDEKDEVAMYRAALGFLDLLRERGAQRGLQLIDRLDAQSVVWCITNWETPGEWPAEDQAAFNKYRQGRTEESEEDEVPVDVVDEPAEESEPSVDPLVALADELLIDHASLAGIAELVKTKGQVVFYGPPGTGKTFVARKIALALSGDPGRVRLVQFHPSYAYEDFVEGYRPKLVDGQPTFAVEEGPLKLLAREARNDPGHEYYLIIDELNRANIAKVFGELYFLLEYRDDEIRLQYSPEPFRLPPNLRVIGTMNTADRSIALLDAALRRRFAFVPFFPDEKPIAGLLGRWLARHRSDMGWLAATVEEANRRLGNRNSAIGPSFFMRKDLDVRRLALVWQHEILPLLEDYFFDAPDRLREFQLSTLRGVHHVSGDAPTLSGLSGEEAQVEPAPAAAEPMVADGSENGHEAGDGAAAQPA